MSDQETAELLRINRRLLDCVTAGDWVTYDSLCDPSLSAFEPEARGHLVEGMEFHRFYLDRQGQQSQALPQNTTISSPHVRIMGDVAIVSYIRLMQRTDERGQATTERFEETRVWQRQEGRWKHVHLHRSANA